MDGRPVSARREDGFTLVELLIGIAIAGMLIAVIGSAMVVGLKTTDATTQRLSESHDAQVTSAYLANDVQSAVAVEQPLQGRTAQDPARAFLGFQYATNQWACYAYGMSGGETRVTRTFYGATDVLLHFAGAAAPSVSCGPSCGAPHVDSVTVSFAEASGYTYSLTGTRRKYSTLEGTNPGGGTTPDLVFFAFGDSPLLIRGKCTNGDVMQQRNGCTAGDVGFASELIVKGNLYINKPIERPRRGT